MYLQQRCVRVCVCVYVCVCLFAWGEGVNNALCGGLFVFVCVRTAFARPERAVHLMSHVLLLFHSLRRLSTGYWFDKLFAVFSYDIFVWCLWRRVAGVCGFV
jgi:hypothetical protein